MTTFRQKALDHVFQKLRADIDSIYAGMYDLELEESEEDTVPDMEMEYVEHDQSQAISMCAKDPCLVWFCWICPYCDWDYTTVLPIDSTSRQCHNPRCMQWHPIECDMTDPVTNISYKL